MTRASSTSKFANYLKKLNAQANTVSERSQADVSIFVQRNRRWYGVRRLPVEGPSANPKDTTRTRKERFKTHRDSVMKTAFKICKCGSDVSVVMLKRGQVYEHGFRFADVRNGKLDPTRPGFFRMRSGRIIDHPTLGQKRPRFILQPVDYVLSPLASGLSDVPAGIWPVGHPEVSMTALSPVKM